jgi:hypothetical protein
MISQKLTMPKNDDYETKLSQNESMTMQTQGNSNSPKKNQFSTNEFK